MLAQAHMALGSRQRPARLVTRRADGSGRRCCIASLGQACWPAGHRVPSSMTPTQRPHAGPGRQAFRRRQLLGPRDRTRGGGGRGTGGGGRRIGLLLHRSWAGGARGRRRRRASRPSSRRSGRRPPDRSRKSNLARLGPPPASPTPGSRLRGRGARDRRQERRGEWRDGRWPEQSAGRAGRCAALFEKAVDFAARATCGRSSRWSTFHLRPVARRSATGGCRPQLEQRLRTCRRRDGWRAPTSAADSRRRAHRFTNATRANYFDAPGVQIALLQDRRHATLRRIPAWKGVIAVRSPRSCRRRR